MSTATRWSVADIADAVAEGLAEAAAALDAEQAVRGLDALDEVALHPRLAAWLAAAGWGVEREQRYPADRRRDRRSEGERCDLVLAPDGRPLRGPDATPTLFDPPDAVDLADAFWLEVKVVAQHGPEGPNARYGTQLLSTVRRDVSKLAKDRDVLHAGVLLLLFTDGEATAAHDLRVWLDRCLALGLPVGAPSLRHVAITDRLGHGTATVAAYRVSHL